MYQERLKKRMLLAEQNRMLASSSMIFASAAQNMPAGRNSDEIILLSGNVERQSTEILPCFVPLQNIQRSTPATPRCSTDELEAISSLVGLGVK